MSKRNKATKAEVQTTKLNALPAGAEDTEYSEELAEDAKSGFFRKKYEKETKIRFN